MLFEKKKKQKQQECYSLYDLKYSDLIKQNSLLVYVHRIKMFYCFNDFYTKGFVAII